MLLYQLTQFKPLNFTLNKNRPKNVCFLTPGKFFEKTSGNSVVNSVS